MPGRSYFVVDAQAREVAIYDSTGLFTRRAAGPGKGPGEFESAGPPIGFLGDSVSVVDMELRRVSVFDEAGQFVAVRRFPLQGVDGYLVPVGLLSSVRFIGLKIGFDRPSSVGDRIVRPEVVVVGLFNSGRVDTVFADGGSEVVGGVWSEGGEALVASYDLPFGRTTKVAVGSGRALVGVTSRAVLSTVDVEGRSTGVLRWASRREAVTDVDRRDWFAQESSRIAATHQGSAGSGAGESIAGLRRLGAARYHPAFTGVVAGDDGSIWVEMDQRPWSGSRRFLVLRPDGRPAATVTVPRPFRLTQADSVSVVGVWREPGSPDEVREYRLEPDPR